MTIADYIGLAGVIVSIVFVIVTWHVGRDLKAVKQQLILSNEWNQAHQTARRMVLEELQKQTAIMRAMHSGRDN